MNLNDLTETSCVVRRLIQASVGVVFKAWTDPTVAARWAWGSDYETISIDLDCQTGGKWRQHIRNKQTGENWFFDGTFQEVRPNERIIHTFHFRSDRGPDEETSLTAIDFNPRGDATEVVITHTQLPNREKSSATFEGWVDVLQCVEHAVVE
jgi:uncharacterized protein YndB with AHSA1/START domain